MPKVSIIIPVYNVEKYLKRALDSVVNQTLTDIEIICVDDCSTDNSLAILKEYEKKDSRFKIIALNENCGVSKARNTALKIACGTYIGFLDPDDKIDYDFYQKLYYAANNHDIIKGNCYKISLEGVVTKSCMNKDIENNGKFAFTHEWWSAIYKASLIFQNKLKFIEELTNGEDGIFLTNALLKSKDVITVDDVYYYYYRRSNSLDSDELPVENIASSVKAKNIMFQLLNEIDISKKTKRQYIYAYNKRLISLFYNMFKNKNYKVRYLCVKSLIDNFHKCKDIVLLRKYFPYKWILEDIEKKDVEVLTEKLINCQKYNDLLDVIPVIVSLTSYPARINTVHKTIESIMNQNIRAEKIILVLEEDEFLHKEKDLPIELIKLQNRGLEILWCKCKDVRSFKKLLPALQKYPNKTIVTADDDILYPNDWLRSLYNAYLEHPQFVHCHRIHRITFDKKGNIRPYRTWQWEINNVPPSYNNFLTGVGGVLYPPGVFYKDIFREDLFKRLCPMADDIWFWAMCVLNNVKINVIPNNISELIYIDNTQEECLCKTNVFENQNDIQLKDVLSYYPVLLNKLNKKCTDSRHNFIQNIFSVNNKDIHKIITICGVKLKIKSKKLIKRKQERMSELQEQK